MPGNPLYRSAGAARAVSQVESGVVQAPIPDNFTGRQAANVPGINTPTQNWTLRVGAPVVHLWADRRGQRNVFGNGARRIPLSPVGWPGDASGRTAPTLANPYANTRVGMSLNDDTHRCGLPLNLGLSFKVPYQYYPNATGMLPAPQYNAVQRVGRSSGAPNAYQTRSSNI